MNVLALADIIEEFNRARGWGERSPNHFAVSVAVEAAELLECFQWLDDAEARERIDQDGEFRERVSSEIADVAIYLFTLCRACHLRLDEAVLAKLRVNAARFPPPSRPDRSASG